jgi:hypothetical protein
MTVLFDEAGYKTLSVPGGAGQCAAGRREELTRKELIE